MQIDIKKILYIPVILLFFPAFAIWIPGLNKGFIINNIIFVIYTIFILLFDYKTLTYKFIQIYNNTPFKYFCWTVIFMILNGILLSIFNFKLLLNVFSSILMYIILWLLPIFIYFIYVIETHISYKNFMKLFIICFWINLIIGIISWLGELFDITILTNIFNFFANNRILYDSNSQFDMGMQSSNFYAFGLPRLDNLFEEPAFYAKFLFLFLPIIYSFSNSKLKIVENTIFNLIIKKSFIFLMWLSIILTFSPIFLIFFVISTIIYYYKEIIKLIRKYWYILIFVLLVFLIAISNFNWQNTYISRIINILSEVNSFEDLILIEQSLASRLVNFINQIYVFFQNPFSGVGFSNLGYAIKEQLLHSPVTLTEEVDKKLMMSIMSNYKMAYNKAFVYEFLAENGIFIFSLFMYFYYKLFKSINIINKRFADYKNSFEMVISRGLKGVLINLFIMFFYAIFFTKCNEFYICLLLSIMFVFYYKKRRNFGKNINYNSNL